MSVTMKLEKYNICVQFCSVNPTNILISFLNSYLPYVILISTQYTMDKMAMATL